MEVKISVTNCTDCPYIGTTRGQGYSYESCYHEDNRVDDYDCELPGYDTGDSLVPPFCPLGLAGTKNIKDQGKFKTVVIDENTIGVKKTELGYSFDGDLAAHSLRVKIDLLVNGHINSSTWIKSEGNLSATGDITAGTSIISSKDIGSEGNISAGTIIYAEGSVVAGNDVRVGTSIRAKRIDAVGCVEVEDGVKANLSRIN